MAPRTVAAKWLALSILCFSCVCAKSRRFGAPARTLHTPPLTESEKYGDRFMVIRSDENIRADEALSLSDSETRNVDSPFFGRFRRSVSQGDHASVLKETAVSTSTITSKFLTSIILSSLDYLDLKMPLSVTIAAADCFVCSLFQILVYNLKV